jgi:O-antigen/teichoic acid export membrane protein
MKTKDQNVPTAVAIRAIGAGLLVMLVFDVTLTKVFDGALWVIFIGGVVEAAVMVGIIRLMLSRVPLRPWARRMWGREE